MSANRREPNQMTSPANHTSTFCAPGRDRRELFQSRFNVFPVLSGLIFLLPTADSQKVNTQTRKRYLKVRISCSLINQLRLSFRTFNEGNFFNRPQTRDELPSQTPRTDAEAELTIQSAAKLCQQQCLNERAPKARGRNEGHITSPGRRYRNGEKSGSHDGD
jgi:hypothetical protein